MHSPSLPYTTAELVRDYANERPAALAWLDVAFVAAARISAVARLFARPLTSRMDQMAVRYARTALALQRLTQDIDEEPNGEQIDPTGDAVQHLMALEADTRAFVASRLSMYTAGQRMSRFAQAALRAAAAASAAADAVRDLRGAIMAHDANVCAMQHAQRVRPAVDAAQLEQDLASLTAS